MSWLNLMKCHSMIGATVVISAAGTMVALPSMAASAPQISGGYTNVVAIPVNDPSVNEIAGALFKPQGAGPFPAIVYMPPCSGPGFPPELQQEKGVIDGMLSKGVATLIVDPFTGRGEKNGVCDTLNDDTYVQLYTRGGDDAVAALKVIRAMPDIDPNKVLLLGYSYGAISSFYATDLRTPGTHDTKIAGVIAYSPFCYNNVDPSAPTLVLIGDKDDMVLAEMCQAAVGKPNFQLVVYRGATRAFTMPWEGPTDYHGHHFAYDEVATKDSQERAEAFIAAQVE